MQGALSLLMLLIVCIAINLTGHRQLAAIKRCGLSMTSLGCTQLAATEMCIHLLGVDICSWFKWYHKNTHKIL